MAKPIDKDLQSEISTKAAEAAVESNSTEFHSVLRQQGDASTSDRADTLRQVQVKAAELEKEAKRS